jgi:hypothetical protein
MIILEKIIIIILDKNIENVAGKYHKYSGFE